MDFTFTDEQNLLRESVQKFIQADYDFDARRKLIASENGFSREHWALFAELGWLGLPFAEDDGGFDGGPIETMILLEEFGKALVVEPYLPTVLLSGGFIKLGGSTELRQALLPALIEGNLQLAFAHSEPQSRYDLADIKTSASHDNDGFVLNGHKAVVFNGAAANKFIVSARTAGAQRDRSGITLFVVDADTAGISLRPYPTVDGLRAADVYFDKVKVSSSTVVGETDAALALIETVTDHAIVALGAEAVGIMEVINNTTVEYCKTRQQFGQPIGEFQVLQHRMVDMFMEYELTKSLLYRAALKLDSETKERQKAVSALKIRVGDAGRYIGQQAIQLHGGMGMTDEMSVSHYFKRLTMIDKTFGDVDYHLRRFGRL